MTYNKVENKHQRDPFEYEDYGTPTMYLWAWLTVIVAIGLAILFALFIAGGVMAVGGALNG